MVTHVGKCHMNILLTLRRSDSDFPLDSIDTILAFVGKPFDNTSLRDAVQLWLSNPEEAKKRHGNISGWNTSEVTDTSCLFKGAVDFNEPIGNWDMRNVTNMTDMFCEATSFNQPLRKWKVSKVTNMSYMFYGATSFNQPIEKWKVSKVTNMLGMFFCAHSFNQPLKSWNVSNVTNMSDMFSSAHSFNQPLGQWDVSENTKMSNMFRNAYASIYRGEPGGIGPYYFSRYFLKNSRLMSPTWNTFYNK